MLVVINIYPKSVFNRFLVFLQELLDSPTKNN